MFETILGRPISHWLFGLRTWAAMMSALYVAFWLEIDGASSAILTAAVLGQPTRGQALSKGVSRFAGTVLGVAASVAIAGACTELRTPFLVAAAAWLALTVYVASAFDENRAYAAVLSGYTVAIVAVANIDEPAAVFSQGVNRGAAIIVGLCATGIIGDLFGAPDLHRGLLERIRAVHGEVRAFARGVIERGAADPARVAAQITRITALRADTVALPIESAAGRIRAASARRAIAGLVRETWAAQVAANTMGPPGEDAAAWRGAVGRAIGDEAASDRLLRRVSQIVGSDRTAPRRLVAARGVESVVRFDSLVVNAIAAMETGRGPGSGPRLGKYVSRRVAARNAMRSFLAVLISAVLLVLAGQPSASTVLLYVCLLSALSTNGPDPRSFAIGALKGIPVAALVAGVKQRPGVSEQPTWVDIGMS